MKIRNKLLSLLLLLALCISALPVYAVEGDGAKSEIPYTDFSGTFVSNYNSTITVYDSASAAANGIPDGYSGYVVKASPEADNGYASIELDFSSWNIPVEDIQSITFRVIFPTGHTEMRLLAEAAPTTWVMRANPPELGTWSDLTLDADGTNFQSGSGMASLANDDGNLGRMCLIGRMGSGSDKGFYLDAVNITYKAGASDDTTAPVITYSGPTTVSMLEGNVFNLEGLSAFDEYDNAKATITYEWSDGAVDGAGALKAGEHVCTVKATDRSGNVATLSYTYQDRGRSSHSSRYQYRKRSFLYKRCNRAHRR